MAKNTARADDGAGREPPDGPRTAAARRGRAASRVPARTPRPRVTSALCRAIHSPTSRRGRIPSSPDHVDLQDSEADVHIPSTTASHTSLARGSGHRCARRPPPQRNAAPYAGTRAAAHRRAPAVRRYSSRTVSGTRDRIRAQLVSARMHRRSTCTGRFRNDVFEHRMGLPRTGPQHRVSMTGWRRCDATRRTARDKRRACPADAPAEVVKSAHPEVHAAPAAVPCGRNTGVA